MLFLPVNKQKKTNYFDRVKTNYANCKMSERKILTESRTGKKKIFHEL